MVSSSPGSSSAISNSPTLTGKKRQVEAESSDSPDDHDTSNASSVDESEADAPQPLPSTVLSHAERRRQKKKQKRELAAAAVASPRKKRKLDDGTASNVDAKPATKAKARAKATAAGVPDEPRRSTRQNSVWVGNLSFRTTKDALRRFFDGVGTITRIHMPMRRGKEAQDENMGFAYVDFDTPEAKVIAVTLSEGQLDGRNLLIKDGDDFTGRPAKTATESFEGLNGREDEKGVKEGTSEQGKGSSKMAKKILRAQKQPPAPTLFLGNLGFETEESIRELFEMHRYWKKDKGKGADSKGNEAGQDEGDTAKSKDVWIRKIRMGTFEDSGNCKGWAFVDFTGIEHATEALVNPRNHRLNGRDLVVEYASPDAVRRGGGPRHPKGDRDQKSKGGSEKVQQKGSTNAQYTKLRRARHTEREDEAEASAVPAEITAPRSRRPEHAGRDRLYTRRSRPGAALAHAQRQSAAILPSQGQKIVF